MSASLKEGFQRNKSISCRSRKHLFEKSNFCNFRSLIRDRERPFFIPLDNRLRLRCQRALCGLKRQREKGSEFLLVNPGLGFNSNAILIKRFQPGPQSTEHLGHPHKEANANIALSGR